MKQAINDLSLVDTAPYTGVPNLFSGHVPRAWHSPNNQWTSHLQVVHPVLEKTIPISIPRHFLAKHQLLRAMRACICICCKACHILSLYFFSVAIYYS